VPRVIGQKVGTDHHGVDVFAPIVIVTIELPGCIATRPAVVDSGADSTIVPHEFLKDCGVDYLALPGSQPGIGAGGGFETRLLTARVKYRDWVVCDEIKVAAPGSKLPLVLLGRADFFTRFYVRFRWDMAPPVVDIDPLARKKVQGSPTR
jgi:hypothetical protein